MQSINWNRTFVSWLGYKNLTFSFFDDDCTQKFFALLNPQMNMPHRNSMKEIVMSEFKNMQNNVKAILQNNSSKLSFSIDGWTAKNMTSYYGITVHFIDKNYTYHSFILDLVAAKGKHTGKHVTELFLNTLKYYGIQDKIQGITLDNAAANTTFIQELHLLLKKENLNVNVNHEDLHFRCFAHIINLAVQDILKLMNVEINNSEDISSEDGEDIYEVDDSL